MDLSVAFVLLLEAISIESGFRQTTIFPWQLYVPLKLRVLASGYHIPMRMLEESKEIIIPHIETT